MRLGGFWPKTCSLPFGSMLSGSDPVLALKSPHSSTFPWAWKRLISVWMLFRVFLIMVRGFCWRNVDGTQIRVSG